MLSIVQLSVKYVLKIYQCTNCAAACKRCDENRPCDRCQKYSISDTCVDGQRKERKKGVKRGPYKRKNKGDSDGSSPYPSMVLLSVCGWI
jgi:hypothetical protein